VGGRLPDTAAGVGRKLFRHIYARDVIPCVPPSVWGHLEHFGHEFHYADGEWRRRDSVTAQMGNFRDVSRSVVAMFAPAKTPPALINRMYEAVRKALEVPQVREHFLNGGYEPQGLPPAEWAKVFREDLKRYAEICRIARIEPQ